MNRYLSNEEETEQFGAELWTLLPEKCLIFLQGQLGAGKTTLVRGFLRATGYSGVVKSPTYTIVEEYLINHRKIVHFDLYRLNDPEELEWIGVRDYFDQNCICFIEWPDLGKGFLPDPDGIIALNNEGSGRLLTMKFNLRK
jgi:tRNA threonylcarbamoyladenosine biosynthesis protein TsaE